MVVDRTGIDRSCVELFKKQDMFSYLDDHKRKLGGCRLSGREIESGALRSRMAFRDLFRFSCVGVVQMESR